MDTHKFSDVRVVFVTASDDDCIAVAMAGVIQLSPSDRADTCVCILFRDITIV